MIGKTIFVSTLFSLSLLAQTLSLSESIDKTLAHHPDIKSFALKISQSQEAYKTSRADYLPQVVLNAEYDPIHTYVFPANGVFNTKDDDGWSAGGIVKQKIWDFSKTTSKMKVSEMDEKIAQLSLEDAKALMVYKVKSLYALLAVQREAVSVREKDMELKKELYNQSEALLSQGMRTKSDSSRFLSAYYAAKDALGIAQANFDKARITLSLYMGEPIDEDVILESTIPRDDLTPPDLTQLNEAMLGNNPEVKLYTKNIQKNARLYDAAFSAHFGSIDAYAAYTHFDTLNSYDAKTVGLTLTVPLYSGGRTSATAQQAKIGEQIAQEQFNAKVLAFQE